MALTRPTLLQTAAFDATQEHIFQFVVQGTGSQVVANKLTIRDQETNQIVYTEKQETFAYQHTVNADELTNGKYYNAVLSVFDTDNNESAASIPIQFYCYTTPTIAFSNLPVNNVVTNSSFNFEFTYNQVQGERIDRYIVELYDTEGEVIFNSDAQYVTDGTPPYNGSYQIKGLETDTQYGISIRAITINDTEISTGTILFTVAYSKPDIFTALQLENNCKGGYIYIKSNLIFIDGDSNPSPPIYIDDKEVDLTNPDHWVEWNDGYTISGDFLARLWFRDPNPYSQIFELSNIAGQSIKLNFMQGYENINSPNLQAYMEAYVDSVDGFPYYIYSNFIDVLGPNDYYCVWLKRVNNIYSLEFAAVT